MISSSESSVLNMDYFSSKFEEFSNNIKKDLLLCIETNLKELRSEINLILLKVSTMEKHINSLENRIDNIEVEGRLSDLIVTGIPNTNSENASDITSKICHAIGYNAKNHILQNFQIKSKYAKPGAAMPLVIKFGSKSSAIEFFIKYKAKQNLSLSDIGYNSDSRIYINCGLTAKNNHILKEAKNFQKTGAILKAYAKSGLIYVITSSTSTPVLVKNLNNLYAVTDNNSANTKSINYINGNKNSQMAGVTSITSSKSSIYSSDTIGHSTTINKLSNIPPNNQQDLSTSGSLKIDQPISNTNMLPVHQQDLSTSGSPKIDQLISNTLTNQPQHRVLRSNNQINDYRSRTTPNNT